MSGVGETQTFQDAIFLEEFNLTREAMFATEDEYARKIIQLQDRKEQSLAEFTGIGLEDLDAAIDRYKTKLGSAMCLRRALEIYVAQEGLPSKRGIQVTEVKIL